MIFRPEEIHAASPRAPAHCSRQDLREGEIHVSDGGRGIDLEDLVVTHADADRVRAIEAPGFDPDLRTET